MKERKRQADTENKKEVNFARKKKERKKEMREKDRMKERKRQREKERVKCCS